MIALLVCAGVVAAFIAARRLARRLGSPPWASPVLIAALAVGVLLWVLGVPVTRFQAVTLPLRWLLGPAIVALGAVIHGNRALIAAQPRALLLAVGGGTTVGVISAVLLARAFGLGPLLIAALATKTLSTPFAVAVAERTGGPVPLAAALAVLTGVIGALIIPALLKFLRIGGSAATGIAMGQAAHLVGTDLLTRRDARAAGWAAVTMVLAGVFAALVLPLVWHWLI